MRAREIATSARRRSSSIRRRRRQVVGGVPAEPWRGVGSAGRTGAPSGSGSAPSRAEGARTVRGAPPGARAHEDTWSVAGRIRRALAPCPDDGPPAASRCERPPWLAEPPAGLLSGGPRRRGPLQHCVSLDASARRASRGEEQAPGRRRSVLVMSVAPRVDEEDASGQAPAPRGDAPVVRRTRARSRGRGTSRRARPATSSIGGRAERATPSPR